MKSKFDKRVKTRNLDQGDQVLLYLPKPGKAFQAKYQRPYIVMEKTGSLNYVIFTPDRRSKTQQCHIDSLKEYHAPKVVLDNITDTEIKENKLIYHPDLPLEITKSLQDFPDKLLHLDADKKQDIHLLIQDHFSLFSDIPRQHIDIEHDFALLDDIPMRQPPCRLNLEKREILRKEAQSILDQGSIEPSHMRLHVS